MVDGCTFDLTDQSKNVFPTAHTPQHHGLFHFIQKSDHFRLLIISTSGSSGLLSEMF